MQDSGPEYQGVSSDIVNTGLEGQSCDAVDRSMAEYCVACKPFYVSSSSLSVGLVVSVGRHVGSGIYEAS